MSALTAKVELLPVVQTSSMGDLGPPKTAPVPAPSPMTRPLASTRVPAWTGLTRLPPELRLTIEQFTDVLNDAESNAAKVAVTLYMPAVVGVTDSTTVDVARGMFTLVWVVKSAMAPGGPWGPLAPCAPCAPLAPWGPRAPCGPLAFQDSSVNPVLQPFALVV